MSSPPRSQPPPAESDEPLASRQEGGNTAPSDPIVESPVADQDNILAEKQERVRRVLWHCLKSPPQVEVKVGPGELRVAAKFNLGDVGVHFEDVKTEAGQIVVVAHLDPLNVEVNFEQLATLAGLEGVEEAMNIWGTMKEQVATAPSALDIGGWSSTESYGTCESRVQDMLTNSTRRCRRGGKHRQSE